jgi:hypothetical protein
LKVKGPEPDNLGPWRTDTMQTTLKKILIPLLATASLLLAGCLLKETTHTLYLDADGSLTWQVLERDIRSDESDPEERAAEEREYLELFSLGRHDVAEGLRVLGPDSLDSLMLHDKRPYTTMTTAHFPAVDAMAREFLYRLGVSGTVDYETSGGEHRLTVCIDVTEDDADPPGEGEAVALAADRESYRIFLTDGVFTEAEGFELEDGGRSATIAEVDEEELEEGGTLVLRLVWRPDPA